MENRPLLPEQLEEIIREKLHDHEELSPVDIFRKAFELACRFELKVVIVLNHNGDHKAFMDVVFGKMDKTS